MPERAMTDAESNELARRAVACKGFRWRWMPGMLDVSGRRVLCVWPDDLGIKWSHIPENCVVRDADALPDLTDAATLGCLLALVREAWESPKANVSWVTYDKCMVVFATGHAQKFLLASTEAEALVAALEAAP